MFKYLPLILVITSCAQLEKTPTPEMDNSREVASLNFDKMSCFDGAKYLINSSTAKKSLEVNKTVNFDPAAFTTYFYNIPVEKIAAQFNDSIIKNQMSSKMVNRLDSIKKKLTASKTAQEFIQKLSIYEKKIVWFSVVKPQMDIAREEALKELSQKGDELASLMLKLPRGEARDNAEVAVTLMKRISPDLSTNQIIAEIQKRMSVCLR